MSNLPGMPRSEARRGAKPPKQRCQVVTKDHGRCKGWGFGGWCQKHTPDRGSGVLRCFSCGEPFAEHEVGPWCGWAG